ncbi:MAG TPA: DUF1844 domain-containing protein, partial [Phycisphaerales bacterium]|nr:DUF1844 domain-containing protein [Phycisphaerales bacterium]
SSNPAPKLIIDSDWKSQAQAEKEKLAAKEAEKAKAPPAGGATGAAASAAGAAATGGHPQQLPPADWQALLGTMVSQALMYMGAYPDPETGRPIVSLEYAKFHIDLIDVMAQKSKGNLTPQESSDLTQVLSELRMRYVELSQAVAKMYAAQLAKGAGGMPGGPGAAQ